MARRRRTVRRVRRTVITVGALVTAGIFVRRHWRGLLILAAFWWTASVLQSTPFAVFLWTCAAGLWVYVWAWRRRKALFAETGERRPFWALMRDWWVERGRRATLLRQWDLACQQSGLHVGKNKRTPTLWRLTSTVDGDFTAVIAPGRIGLVVTDVLKAADRIRQIVGCYEVTVTPLPDPAKAKVCFYWKDSISRVLPLTEMPASKAGQIAYGIRQNGLAAVVLLYLSILIGGLTRHGKSNAVKALIADLINKKVPFRLYISDPKGGMELSDFGLRVGEQLGPMQVVEYVTDEAGTVAMVKRAHAAMLERQRTQKTKDHVPSVESPLTIVLLDELLMLSDMLKKGTAGELGKILFTGAASGFVVWANTQVGHEAELGRCRDLFPQRLCFATRTSQTTDTILGTGAESLGARCSQIHVAGVGYSSAEHSQQMERFRGALVTPEDAECLSRGVVPDGMGRRVVTRHQRYAMYHLWSWEDESGARRLLYVGITDGPKRRLAQHAKDKPWWPEVDPSATGIVWLQDEASARREEALAIEGEMPLYNEVHNGGNPTRRRRLRSVA